ncbi:MAG: methionine adenosyltransferase [Proteobacteria bacterium]|nr:methionine adenosyltransferase [Pseudomonadota bacterium]
MTLSNFLFTSESVGEGHPDKVADQLSDAVLDEFLKHDPTARVACETLIKDNVVILAGEITSKHVVNYEKLVRAVVKDIGYDDSKLGFDDQGCSVMTFISQQSPDISMGVNEHEGLHKEQGAGDQGLMFGFACDETQELMPLPISLSHQLMKALSRDRRTERGSFLKPDAKSQVTVQYRDGRPESVHTVVISTQHTEETSLKDLEEYVIERIVKKVIPAKYLTNKTKYLINPTGRFVIGGPVGDCGLTGRKIIVDTYGGYSRHGGGAFSGKDPSKVDRSAAYAARYIAKNVVAAGLAQRCEVQVAYAIGVAKPVSVYVNTFGTGVVSEDAISTAVREIFDLTPRGIIKCLDLLKPIYRSTAAYGHFGRDPGNDGSFSWERTDKVATLKAALSK